MRSSDWSSDVCSSDLLFGGEALPGKGAYMSAGVLVDVPLDDRIANEELFGPVAMVFKVADVDEAIALANAVPFGLVSSVWTSAAAENERFERDLDDGMTAIKPMIASAPAAHIEGAPRPADGPDTWPYGRHQLLYL